MVWITYLRFQNPHSRTTLPIKLDEDLVILSKKNEQLRDHSYNKIFRITNAKELEELRDRQQIVRMGDWLKKNMRSCWRGG